jgi:CubicO group peptidase (beta-lactamase class C family)
MMFQSKTYERAASVQLPTAVRVALRAGVCAAALLLASCGQSEQSSADANSAAKPGGYPHATEEIGTVRQVYDGTLTPDLAVATFRNIDRLFPTREVKAGGTPAPLPKAEKQLTQVKFTSNGKAYDLFDYLALNRVSGLMILKDGKVAYETYQYGNTPQTRWMSMSVVKSVTSTLFGAAVKDGLITSISDPVTKYVPKLVGTAYDGVTIRDIMMMSSGVKWNEAYTDPASDRRALLEAQISQKPGAALDVMAKLPRAAPVGSLNTYSTGETQVAVSVC